MWDKLEYPPQPFGKCSICNRHDCGEVVVDGVKEQRWLHMPLELFVGGDLYIGYQCVRGMSEDLGVAVRVVEKEIHVEPSDEQLLRVMRDALGKNAVVKDAGPIEFPPIEESDTSAPQPNKRQRRASK